MGMREQIRYAANAARADRVYLEGDEEKQVKKYGQARACLSHAGEKYRQTKGGSTQKGKSVLPLTTILGGQHYQILTEEFYFYETI